MCKIRMIGAFGFDQDVKEERLGLCEFDKIVITMITDLGI